MSDPELSVLRSQIDSIDEQLVLLLARRFEVTDKIGKLKAVLGLKAVDRARESMQESRLSELAAQHSLNPTVVLGVFRTVVAEVVCRHKALAAAAEPNQD